MLKISYAGCLGLSPTILSQITSKMCATAKNCKKIHQNSIFGSLRSFKIIDVDKYKKPISSACYDMQHVRAYMHPFSLYTR